MKPCAEWHEELLDHALGATPGAALAAHFAGCAACAAALVHWRGAAERLDASLPRLTAAEPPPYLAARVLARIESAPTEAFGFGWRAALAGLALAVGLAAVIYTGRAARAREEAVVSAAAALSRWRSPTNALLRSPGDALLKSVPQLGRGYFRIMPVLEPEPAKGGRDVS